MRQYSSGGSGSAYLGHVRVNDTYWYIEAIPELLHLATERLVSNHEEVQS